MSKHACSAKQKFRIRFSADFTIADGFSQTQDEVDHTDDYASSWINEATCQNEKQKNCDLFKVNFCGSLGQVKFKPVFSA